MTEDQLRPEEYKRCWDLFIENIKAVERNEIYAVGAIAAVMGFSLSSHEPLVSIGSSLVAILIAYLGRMRYVGFGIIAGALNAYIQETEQQARIIGWVTYQRQADVGGHLRRMRFLLWKVLLASTTAFALFVTAVHGAHFAWQWSTASSAQAEQKPPR